jgi:pimeloyl-ACP methyl ester carboxylesterase
MLTYFTCLFVALLGTWQPPQTRFAQVAPTHVENKEFVRSKNCERAVILIHGLTLRVFGKGGAQAAEFTQWQQPSSPLVKKLAQQADVYAFAYGQTTAADDVPEVTDLGLWVQRLSKLGYKEIVLIGFSAGGVVAREFVEDNPDSGVTKVVQVCTPNEGSFWAKVRAVRSNQADFLASLTKDTRDRVLRSRSGVRIPDKVEFACIVGSLNFLGDAVVSCRSQWSEDLQKQGIPVYPLGSTHWRIMFSDKAVEKMAELVREQQPRWDAKRVAVAKKELLGN